MRQNISTRLSKLEQATENHSSLKPYLDKAYYDEISDELKEQYCSFIGIERRVFEEVNLAALGDLHVLLRRITKPTPSELEQIRKEVAEMVHQKTDSF